MTLTHQTGRAGATRRGDRQRGVILPLMAMSMVSLLLLATLVIDGSHAYPQRRDMQNAADAAALAGTRALDKARYSGGAWSAVQATATSVAADNGAESSTCTIVDRLGADVGPCTTTASNAQAAGVRVVATDVRATSFSGITAQDSVSAKARATATIQTFVGGTGTPFIVCGNPALGGYPILRPNGTIDPATSAAMGRIPLQSSSVPGCGAGAAFKGKIRPGEVVDSIPADVTAENGNGFNHDIQVTVVGGTPCTEEDVADMGNDKVVSCDIVLPIADAGWGNGTSIGLHAVAWGVFHVTGTGQGDPKYYGEFVGTNAFISGGRTSTDVPTDGTTPRAIRLIA